MQIYKYPSKILLQPCLEVVDYTNARKTFENLLISTESIKALGISANQVGMNGRFFSARINEKNSNEIEIVSNPYILREYDSKEISQEGCLSFPGLVIEIERPSEIIVEYDSYEISTGKIQRIERKLKGLPARVFQHEYEHINGKTFLNNFSNLKRSIYLKKYLKASKM